jgi:ubiquinone/menaquinone biosynthesis C-methylase UbiE
MAPRGKDVYSIAPWEAQPLETYLSWPDNPHFYGSQKLVLRYLERVLAPGERVSLLDAPCGNGRLHRGLVEHGLLDRVEYHGLDLADKVLEAARRLLRDAHLTKGSVEAIPFPDESFDVVVSQHIIRHLASYEQAVRELLRVSRRLVVIVEKDASEKGDQKAVGFAAETGRFWTNAWDPTRLKQFARENGAMIAFTLNDAGRDDPDAQFVYVLYK